MTTYTYTTVNDPLSTYTYAQGINDGGEVVGYYYDSAGFAHGFRDSGGNFTTLDYPSGIANSQTYPRVSTTRARSLDGTATGRATTASCTAAASTPPSTTRWRL